MILEELQKKQIEALKSKDMFRLGVIRYLISQIKYREIELRPQHQELTDEIVLKLLQKQVKKREEIIEEYRKANRQDLVDKESKEVEIVKELVAVFTHE